MEFVHKTWMEQVLPNYVTRQTISLSRAYVHKTPTQDWSENVVNNAPPMFRMWSTMRGGWNSNRVNTMG